MSDTVVFSNGRTILTDFAKTVPIRVGTKTIVRINVWYNRTSVNDFLIEFPIYFNWNVNIKKKKKHEQSYGIPTEQYRRSSSDRYFSIANMPNRLAVDSFFNISTNKYVLPGIHFFFVTRIFFFFFYTC